MARRTGISVKQRGDFNALKRFVSGGSKWDQWLIKRLRIYGITGVQMLQDATPKASGKTALRWHYRIEKERHGTLALSFYNDATSKTTPNIVALLVYGHATRDGKWVEGRDFVTPVADPIFAEVQEEIRREAVNIGK